MLKSAIRDNYKDYPLDVRAYLKVESVQLLGTQSALLRSIAGILVTNIALCGGLNEWPDLIPTLVSGLESGNQAICEVKKKLCISP